MAELDTIRVPCSQPLYEFTARWDAAIKDVRALICEATGLKPGSMVIARGRMGQRISDSSDNLFGDAESLWECGFSVGDEVAYMYFGDGTADLGSGPLALK